MAAPAKLAQYSSVIGIYAISYTIKEIRYYYGQLSFDQVQDAKELLLSQNQEQQCKEMGYTGNILWFLDEKALPGLKFALICQPMKAAIWNTYFTQAASTGTLIVSQSADKVLKKIMESSIVFQTSLVYELINLVLNNALPSHQHNEVDFADEISKQIPIIICKQISSKGYTNKLLCNILAEYTRELPKISHDFLTNQNITITFNTDTLTKKPSKALHKTAHQLFEKGYCVQTFGNFYGYIFCGWTRKMFYEFGDCLRTTSLGVEFDPSQNDKRICHVVKQNINSILQNFPFPSELVEVQPNTADDGKSTIFDLSEYNYLASTNSSISMGTQNSVYHEKSFVISYLNKLQNFNTPDVISALNSFYFLYLKGILLSHDYNSVVIYRDPDASLKKLITLYDEKMQVNFHPDTLPINHRNSIVNTKKTNDAQEQNSEMHKKTHKSNEPYNDADESLITMLQQIYMDELKCDILMEIHPKNIYSPKITGVCYYQNNPSDGYSIPIKVDYDENILLNSLCM